VKEENRFVKWPEETTDRLEDHKSSYEKLANAWHHGRLAVKETTHLANSLFGWVIPRSVADGHWDGALIPQVELRCLLSQVYDYLGQTERARLCVRDGEAVFCNLHRESSTSQRSESRVLHRKIRLCLECRMQN